MQLPQVENKYNDVCKLFSTLDTYVTHGQYVSKVEKQFASIIFELSAEQYLQSYL